MVQEIIEERPVSLSHVKKFLSDNEKKGELNFRANKTLDYVKQFKLKSMKDVASITKKIEELDIPRMKDIHILKIIDIMPATVDELKVVMQGSGLTLNNDHLKKIVDVLNS